MQLASKAAVALLLLSGSLISAKAAETPLPDAIAAPGETVVLSVHAEGAQVYECKVSADGKLGWAFREPIATLLADGRTVGRHSAGPSWEHSDGSAGPSWEHSDGSAVVGKAVGNAPGATANDIPWLKLEVVSQRGSGILSGVTTVQRINTMGGKLEGPCDKAGTFRSAPYSADYVLLRKG
jgi:hypothetical protein